MAKMLSDGIAGFALPFIAGCVASVAMGIGTAKADAFKVSFESAGVQNANTAALCSSTSGVTCTIGVESFDTRASNASFTTNFGTGGTITGVYSATPIIAADQYGGAGGTGKYPVANSGAPYSVALTTTLTTGINYFGFWLSALDSGNQVGFYKNNALVYSFAPNDLIKALGACNASNAYCGNPNSASPRTNNTQLYAFVNFLDTNGTFDSVRFTENPAQGGYESDNHTVGYATTESGTNVSVPEPASLALLAFALAGLSLVRRRPARDADA